MKAASLFDRSIFNKIAILLLLLCTLITAYLVAMSLIDAVDLVTGVRATSGEDLSPLTPLFRIPLIIVSSILFSISLFWLEVVAANARVHNIVLFDSAQLSVYRNRLKVVAIVSITSLIVIIGRYVFYANRYEPVQYTVGGVVIFVISNFAWLAVLFSRASKARNIL